MKNTCGDYGGVTRKAKTRCGKPAGWGTNHLGTGKCRIHGGSEKMGRPPVHGRYAVKHREKLHSKMQEFLNDPAPANLMPELAIQRALLQDFLERLTDQPLDAKSSGHIFEMTESISRLVERITKMLNQTALTQMDVRYLQAILTDMIVRYIDDPAKRAEFVAELRSAFGADTRADRTKSLRAPAQQSIE